VAVGQAVRNIQAQKARTRNRNPESGSYIRLPAFIYGIERLIRARDIQKYGWCERERFPRPLHPPSALHSRINDLPAKRRVANNPVIDQRMRP